MFNFIDIEFPNSGLPLVLSYRTTFHQARYEHEEVTMYIKNWGVQYARIQNGTPIQATFKSPTGSRTFQGYVHSVTPDLSPGKNFAQVVAYGASYVMKQASQKIWTNVTADTVVAEIAKKYGFSYNAMPHPRVYDHLIQAGESDWAFLVKLAKQCGYSLRAENTALYFNEITNDYKQNFQSAKYAIMREANSSLGSSMFKFTPEVSEANDIDAGVMKAATAVGGVNLDTATAIVTTNQSRPTTTKTVSKSEMFDRFSPTVVISNGNVASSEAKAADERARYPYRGSVQLLGDATLKPDLPIYLDGLGTEYSGYWTILSADHIFEEHMYTTELHVGSDSLGKASPGFTGSPDLIPSTVPKRQITPNVAQTNKKVTSSLSQNSRAVNGATKSTSLVATNNRKQPKVGRTDSSSSAKWSGPVTNLLSAPKKTNLSSAAVAKLRSTGVR